MASRRIGVSEARRLLPELVKTIAEQGGHVDITHRGQPRVTLVRTSDLSLNAAIHEPAAHARGLDVEFAVDAAALIDVIRELRGRVGSARSTAVSVGPLRRKKQKRMRRGRPG